MKITQGDIGLFVFKINEKSNILLELHGLRDQSTASFWIHGISNRCSHSINIKTLTKQGAQRGSCRVQQPFILRYLVMYELVMGRNLPTVKSVTVGSIHYPSELKEAH